MAAKRTMERHDLYGRLYIMHPQDVGSTLKGSHVQRRSAVKGLLRRYAQQFVDHGLARKPGQHRQAEHL